MSETADDAPTAGEMIERWYVMGRDAALSGLASTGCYRADSIAHHWWSRGYQGTAANLDRQRLMRERDEARYAARLLEHAYQHDSRPAAEALQIVRAWGSNK